ncbi:MAG: Phosphodiester glycosidase [Bacillota bacterium]|jgi:exopolysaccharide biosynthesis protein|nr:Phosphodiester glycosidase [Bacillota bacterium]
MDVKYTVTLNKTHQLCGDVNDFGVKIINKRNTIIEEPNCINGTFFWHDYYGVTYPTSILFVEGVIYKADSNHKPYPQSVFIINKNNTVEMKLIKNLNELSLSNIRFAIGGVGLRNTLDKNFKYNPKEEGFTGVFADVLGRRNKTVIGYNKKENKIYLMCRPNIIHKETYPWKYDLLKLVKDCEYDIALSLDGGGSTFMNNKTKMVFYGDGRKINNILGFNL